MCQLCKQGDNICDDCGFFICWDIKSHDDFIRPAYVTEVGDLKCSLCGPEYDEYDPDDYEDYFAPDLEDE